MLKFTFMLFKPWLNSSSCVNGGHCHLGNCVVRKQLLDHEMYLITQPVHVLPCSNSAMKHNNETNRLYHDIVVQTITLPPPCFTVRTTHSGVYASLGDVNSSRCRGTRYCNWLRHCATSRKVVGSTADEVIALWNLPDPSSRTMALGSTQPLTDMSTRNLPVGNGRPPVKADYLTAICEPIA
jgi:hypothetical protein